MSNFFCVDRSRPSRLRRLSFLPRVGVVVDFGGRTFTFKQAPLLEAIWSLGRDALSMKRLFAASMQQLEEISIAGKVEGLPQRSARKAPRRRGRQRIE